MQSEHKTKIAIVLGIALIAFVASLMSLPFTKSDAGVQKIPENSIKKMEASEERILKFMAHEKNELQSKIYNNP
ncbi:hypothetical protein [Candidatus Nitrosotenuis cloacae]|jgi:hypothetical protein|uniref:hypothetical protein n=1 Tax=Candidatus Nitrosotenuis cloacae TaxID=1603555 RepID=UPI0022824730|nr:hypothetical protein [Candidatus Nitrosotenuis cloacae]